MRHGLAADGREDAPARMTTRAGAAPACDPAAALASVTMAASLPAPANLGAPNSRHDVGPCLRKLISL